MSELPLVSIIMPVYNPGPEIKYAVKSIINQTYTNWELLIIDDGSDHDIKEIELLDPRIFYYKNSENKKIHYRLNEAVEMSKGLFLARMDHDDISYPTRLQQQVEFLLENSHVHVTSVRAIAIDKLSKPLGYIGWQQFHKDIIKRPWRGFNLIHPSWMGRRDWFKKHPYKSNYLCEDQILLLNAHKDSVFYTLPEVLFAYRVKETFKFKNSCKTAVSLFKNQLKAFIKDREARLLMMSIANCLFKMVSFIGIKIFLAKNYTILKYRNKLNKKDLDIYYSVYKKCL